MLYIPRVVNLLPASMFIRARPLWKFFWETTGEGRVGKVAHGSYVVNIPEQSIARTHCTRLR